MVVIADNIQSDNIFSREERLAWVAWHELGHNGVNVRLSGVYKNLMKHARTNSAVSVIGRKIQQRYKSDGVTLSQDVATEEAIVELFAAAKTGNWDKLEQDYGVKIHHSWKTGNKTIGSFLEKMIERLRRLIGAVIGRELSKATSEDILSILKQVEQGVNSSQNQTASSNQDTVSSESRYSLSEEPNSEFAKAVDAFVNGDEVQTSVSMGTTPEVLKMIGLPDVEVKIQRKTLGKVMRGKHAIEPETLKQLPQQLNDPVGVFQSSPNSSNPDGYVVLTELTEFNEENNRDEPVIAALHLDTTGEVQLIEVASSYGKNHKGLQNILNKDKAYYWNKTKGSQLANVHWLQLPLKLRSNANLSANDIKSEADLRQYQSENSTRQSRKSQDLSETAYNQAKENGETELTFQQWKQVRSPEFKAWFG